MRFRPGKMALAGILAIGVSATETRQAAAGDGFARLMVQQARHREQARLRNQRRARGQTNRVVTPAPRPVPRYYGGDSSSAPARSYTPSSGSMMRDRISSSSDPSGRHDGLARPWLR